MFAHGEVHVTGGNRQHRVPLFVAGAAARYRPVRLAVGAIVVHAAFNRDDHVYIRVVSEAESGRASVSLDAGRDKALCDGKDKVGAVSETVDLKYLPEDFHSASLGSVDENSLADCNRAKFAVPMLLVGPASSGEFLVPCSS